jgi:hypothetical protein
MKAATRLQSLARAVLTASCLVIGAAATAGEDSGSPESKNAWPFDGGLSDELPMATTTRLDGDDRLRPASFFRPAKRLAGCKDRCGDPFSSLSIGEFTLRGYGTVWCDILYATSRTEPARFTLWIASEQEQGEAAFDLDARRSRIGVDITGPPIALWGDLSSGGRFEVDFLGNFTTDNQPDTRLRHVYFEAQNERRRLLVGQTWDVVSPLLPNTVNFPVAWAAGNVGFRRNQFRIERYGFPGDTRIGMQAAIAQNVIQDLASGFNSVGVTRETGNWPMIQTRMVIGWDDVRGAGESMAFGISGHIGETGFDFAAGDPANPALGPEDDVRVRTWSINADGVIPLTDRVALRGEWFAGENLSNILGGIVQGVCPCLRQPIAAMGGWAEMRYLASQRVSFHIGYSIDDPNDEDSLIGRTKNQTLYGNVFYRVTEKFTSGWEVSWWRTDYQNRTNEPGFTPVDAPSTPGEAIQLDWTLRYAF